MATFEVRVEGLTGLSIDSSSSPTQDELTEFLKDGVIDVTNRCVALKPQDRVNFIRESATTSSNGLDLNGADIISVIREAGADGDTDGSTAWRPCRQIPISQQSRVVDTESLSFASKYNPVYAIDVDGTINVYPTPDGTDDGFRVFYVNHAPKDGSGGDLEYDDSTISFFPNDKIFLVVLYASMQSLMAKITSLNSALPSDIALPSVPAAPILTSVTFTSVDSALDTVKPIFATATISASSTYTGDVPTFTPPAMSAPDFGGGTGTEGLITTEEDSEMLAARVQEIQAKIGEYSAKMAEAQAEFNKENVAYQSAIQESTQELQVANQVNLAEAQADLQVAMKNKDRDLQRQLQNGVNDMQAIINDNNRKTSTYQSDIQKYSAEVAGKTQEFTTSLQKDQADYQWTTAQYTSLKMQYDEAFAIMKPPAPQQQQQQVARRRR